MDANIVKRRKCEERRGGGDEGEDRGNKRGYTNINQGGARVSEVYTLKLQTPKQIVSILQII